MTTREEKAPAVLYICAQPSPGAETRGLAEKRATEEGRDFATRHGLSITEVITDPYGEPVPQKRNGWNKVRELAKRGEVGAVITRWPTMISPNHERRYPEVAALQDCGTQVLFSWAPLAATVGGGATR
ncbi:hypothetical protein [Streptomyces natalensis]|uniref:Resolvase/invertase-type recombinase catalytic domain-containing protein n=1 Tax=Streptomyces natalensis ATCC 27448 TaxID=1240678 RepID=A0A0D7CII4_9ACTN|nr:hypothetical protein [Streptomyces natalensis]KIZ15675.1 hypothetical protein SNA_25370 [Streptomyces natalensis ATCC 27448]